MSELELQESVIHINRVAKVVKGGRNFAFTALVAVGDGNGNAGIGYGKGSEVPLAIQKAIEDAKKNISEIPMAGSTIVHSIIGKHGSSRVLLKPAAPGTGRDCARRRIRPRRKRSCCGQDLYSRPSAPLDLSPAKLERTRLPSCKTKPPPLLAIGPGIRT